MLTHFKVAKDFSDQGIFIYQSFFYFVEKELGNLNIFEKYRLRKNLEKYIDERLTTNPTFYLTRKTGRPCSFADIQQIEMVMESVVYDYKRENLFLNS